MTTYAIVFWVCVIIMMIGFVTVMWLGCQLAVSVRNIVITICWFLPVSFAFSTFAMATYGNVVLILILDIVDTIFGTNIAEGAPKHYIK